MKAKKNIIGFLMSLAAFLAVSPTYAQDYARMGDEAYSKGNYNEAISLYHKAMERDGVSTDLYYNLGNAYYRTDSIAMAVLSYERALKLDPTNSDARTNLEFVNDRTEDKLAESSSYSTIFIDKAMEMLTANGWAVMSAVLFLLVLVCAGGYIFSGSIPVRKFSFFTGLVLLLVMLGSLVITFMVTSRMTSRDTAIVTASSTQLSTSPATPVNSSQQAFILHGGTKVTVLDSVATPLDPQTPVWYEVKVDNQHRAWIDKNDVEMI